MSCKINWNNSLSKIKDSNDRRSLVTLNGFSGLVEYFSPTYMKATLNGKSLDVVIAGIIAANTTVISSAQFACTYHLTKDVQGDYDWIFNKIYAANSDNPIVSQGTMLYLPNLSTWVGAKIGPCIVLKDFQGKSLAFMGLQDFETGDNGGYVRLEYHLTIEND